MSIQKNLLGYFLFLINVILNKVLKKIYVQSGKTAASQEKMLDDKLRQARRVMEGKKIGSLLWLEAEKSLSQFNCTKQAFSVFLINLHLAFS